VVVVVKKPAKAFKPKRTRKHPSELVKRDAAGNKIMTVARGIERARRRAGLVFGWHNKKDVKQMLPPVGLGILAN
jgi:hypothetical protein